MVQGYMLEPRGPLWLTTAGEIAHFCTGLPEGVIP